MWRAAASRLLLHRRLSPATTTAACTLRNLRHLSAEAEFTTGEARRVVRLVGVEMLKRSLRDRSEEVISYGEFLEECMEVGAARTREQAEVLARAMEQSGVVLLFRGKVYLHPEKVVDLVGSGLPVLVEERAGDVRKEEFEALEKKKQEIETLAHKQVRRVLWTGLAFLQTEVCTGVRLTYWEFSWDVMGPITYFTAGTHLLAAYAYFLVTSSDMSYRTCMERLFDTRWRKLCVKQGFDMEKYRELERQIRCPLGGEHSKGPATKAIFADIEWWLSDRQKDQVDYSDAYNKFLWMGKAYPNHQKVCDLVKRAVPFALTPENDARKEEFKQLQKMMKEIEGRAHKHVRRIKYLGLAGLIFQFVFFFRLAFWELSWAYSRADRFLHWRIPAGVLLCLFPLHLP